MFGYLCWGIQSICLWNFKYPPYLWLCLCSVSCICKQYIGSDNEIWVKKLLFESWLCHLTSLWVWNYSIHQVSVSFSSRVGLQNVNGNVTCKIWHSKPAISGFFPPLFMPQGMPDLSYLIRDGPLAPRIGSVQS